MSGDIMEFPDTVEEFMEEYKMVDKHEIYSNGTEYVPIFRMEQWFEHCKAQSANAKRYIDADAFKRNNADLLHCDFPYLCEDTLEEIIDDEPSADVAPVVHGKWIMINEQLAKCSVCGGYESTNGKDKTGKGVIFKMQKKFCPHCGADMRGGHNEQIH